MSITRPELAVLTFLLENKPPNIRSSTITLSGNIQPIKVENRTIIENIQEVKDILISLEEKGIIKIDEMETIMETENYDEIEKLNIMYILGQLNDVEYEKLFTNALSRLSRNEFPRIVPLTRIQKYLDAIKKHLSAVSRSDFEYYDALTFSSESKKHNSVVRKNSATFKNILKHFKHFKRILNIFQEYVQRVIEITGNSNIESVESKAFIYLYPFVQPLVKRAKKKVIVTETKLIERLKKEIQVKKEVINVLELLREDERKIESHRVKLRTLENKLKELERYEEREVFVLALTDQEGNVNSPNDLLMNLFGKPPIYIVDTLSEFISMLSTTLFKNISGNGRKELEIDLHLALNELQGKENVRVEDQLMIKVSLIWMNEFCPAMQDSLIDSEGRELELCKNPECFVVYHKRCLDSFRQAGVHSCLVCGQPI